MGRATKLDMLPAVRAHERLPKRGFQQRTQNQGKGKGGKPIIEVSQHIAENAHRKHEKQVQRIIVYAIGADHGNDHD